MDDTSTIEAVSSILRSLACDMTLQHVPKSNYRVKLPGADSDAKVNLEIEIAALMARVETLEAKSIIANKLNLPDTPNELGRSFPFGDVRNGLNPGRNGEGVASSQQAVNLPPGFSDGFEEPSYECIKVAEEDLRILQEGIDDQSEQLNSQRAMLGTVDAHLFQQKQHQERANGLVEAVHISSLERELRKHQQANEAFQKALREIGEIITAVARGDLSKKLQIHSVEMDPEITTFKMVWPTLIDIVLSQADLFDLLGHQHHGGPTSNIFQ